VILVSRTNPNPWCPLGKFEEALVEWGAALLATPRDAIILEQKAQVWATLPLLTSLIISHPLSRCS